MDITRFAMKLFKYWFMDNQMITYLESCIKKDESVNPPPPSKKGGAFCGILVLMIMYYLY